MRLAPFAVAAILAAVAAPLAAQDGASRGPGGPGGRPMMNPLAFDGPPPTAEFTKIVGLTAAQQPKYEALRKSYLTSTQAQRDSAKAIRESMRAAMQGGDRTAAQPSMEQMRSLGTALGQRYEELETELGFLLTKEQQAKFDAWNEAERARRMEERRQRMAR